MFRLAWFTDIHLNFLRMSEACKSFGQYMAKEADYDAAVISGDISESPTLKLHLESFVEGLGKSAHFVLGNHDFYGSSIHNTLKKAAKLANWLTRDGVIELTPETALVGHDGWYDTLLGDPYSDFYMADWECIKEYRRQFRRHERGGVIHLSQDLGLSAVREFRPILERALEQYPLVIMATHVPPFKQSAWHDFRPSSPKTLPWYTSKLMGDMLLEVLHPKPNRRLLVLCGHTHSSANYQPLPNLQVLTGSAKYYAPDLAGILKISGSQVTVQMKTENSWANVKLFK
jgi:Icc protein